MAYVELLKEIIVDENFTFVKFYKKIDFPFVQKAKAEEVLYKALETVASENNTKAQKLLVNFNELINSTSVKIYWNSVYVRDERDKTKLFRTILKEKLVRIFDTGYDSDLGLYNGESSSSDSEAVPILLTNVFLEVKDSGVGDDNNILESVDNYDNNVDNNEQSNPEVYQSPILDNNILESVNHEVQQTPIPESVDNNKENDSVPKRKVTRSKPKYIQHDLAQELLTNLRLCPLKGHKWLWEDIDIINLFKNNKNTKTPLSIGVANFHNNSCVQHLPPSMITYIQKQMENDEDTIYFDNEKKVGIDKFAIDVEDEVMEFLNKFRDCVSLHVYC
ncbi:hypothetical protein C2G38_2299434 [Gigaspora rosea]|uniref:Uncharacterized protein n=1 Tax=Gigaspora rosea TaxID=44941 RepID=A0A397VGJ8_9GLOM|nr:hypothetical protein C2G38_2299434 [Gigaspora rosea]